MLAKLGPSCFGLLTASRARVLAMDCTTRRMKRVEVEITLQADYIFMILMGDVWRQ